ncbi:MAG: RHS repeat-associated core domain-containing protein, partial [Planctomycetota bacterium]|nr:RHS repeat-associated core domain-containing protein [Planctomycetota bacterium]
FVYDGDDIVLAYNGAGSVTNRYLVGPNVDEILADEIGSGTVTWSLADNLGSVRDLAQYTSGTNTTTVVNHVVYDTFGQIKSQTNTTWQPLFAYTGREWDADAGLYYYRARWYDARVGRFLSEDPLGFAAGDVNLSRYVANSATMFVDPSGLEETPVYEDPSTLVLSTGRTPFRTEQVFESNMTVFGPGFSLDDRIQVQFTHPLLDEFNKLFDFEVLNGEDDDYFRQRREEQMRQVTEFANDSRFVAHNMLDIETDQLELHAETTAVFPVNGAVPDVDFLARLEADDWKLNAHYTFHDREHFLDAHLQSPWMHSHFTSNLVDQYNVSGQFHFPGMTDPSELNLLSENTRGVRAAGQFGISKTRHVHNYFVEAGVTMWDNRRLFADDPTYRLFFGIDVRRRTSPFEPSPIQWGVGLNGQLNW